MSLSCPHKPPFAAPTHADLLPCDPVYKLIFVPFSDNPMPQLRLSNSVKNAVSQTRKEYIKLRGARVLICVPEFYRGNGLKFNVNKNVTSVLVRLDEATLSPLSTVGNFVKANVEVERCKPLWLRDEMFVNV